MIGELGVYREVSSKDVHLRPLKFLTRDIRNPKDTQRMQRKRRLAIPHWIKRAACGPACKRDYTP